MENKKLVKKKPHAIMISIAYQGHINPFVNLAIKLASKGFAITFVHLDYVHDLISKSHHNSKTPSYGADIFSEARNSGLDIRYTTMSDGYPLEFDRNHDVSGYWEHILRDYPSLVDEFVGNLIKSSDPSLEPFLVADTLASWTGEIAKKYNLVNVSFWTEPALVFAISYYVGLLRENGHFPPKDNQEYNIDYIPGVNSISTKDLMAHFQEVDDTTIVHKIVYKAFEEVNKADFVLHNTVQELESHTLSALNQIHPNYAIGPLNFSTKINVSKSLLSETDCTAWLDAKPPGSVMYVSFGSLVQTDKHTFEQIAKGLLLSGVNFVWVVRHDIITSTKDDSTNILPKGFQGDAKDRGLFVPWCNQYAVLSNPSIGGFLTHCGWNSILESIWWGIPMICYPVLYDQPTNRKVVVDDWKVGINLCDGESVSGEEVAVKIRKVMSGETCDCIKHEMKKIRGMLHSALGEDGSSERNFDQFINDFEDEMRARREEA